mgnify:CR=1 FL=1
MREIKFRAWNESAKRYSKPFGLKSTVLNFTDDGGLGVVKSLTTESVYQYTGLKDKNGVEIYEGDILSDKEYTLKVEYNTQNSGFFLNPIDFINNVGEENKFLMYMEYQKLGNGYYSRKDLEVIGNIHKTK